MARSALTSGQPCRRRIYEATLDARLLALDAATGAPCAISAMAAKSACVDVAAYRPAGIT